MTTTRKQYSAKFKTQVAVEAIRDEKTLSQLGSQYKVHSIQIAKWRKAAPERLPELFVDGRTRQTKGNEAETEALFAQIGRWKVELDWLKKSRDARLKRLALCQIGLPQGLARSHVQRIHLRLHRHRTSIPGNQQHRRAVNLLHVRFGNLLSDHHVPTRPFRWPVPANRGLCRYRK